jgi:hypothetical protein
MEARPANGQDAGGLFRAAVECGLVVGEQDLTIVLTSMWHRDDMPCSIARRLRDLYIWLPGKARVASQSCTMWNGILSPCSCHVDASVLTSANTYCRYGYAVDMYGSTTTEVGRWGKVPRDDWAKTGMCVTAASADGGKNDRLLAGTRHRRVATSRVPHRNRYCHHLPPT